MRRVECVPPSDLVVNVDSNHGGDRWIRLSIQVPVKSSPITAPSTLHHRHLAQRPVNATFDSVIQFNSFTTVSLMWHDWMGSNILSRMRQRAQSRSDIVMSLERLWTAMVCVQKAGGPAPVKQVQIKGADSADWRDMNNLWGAPVPPPPIPSRDSLAASLA